MAQRVWLEAALNGPWGLDRQPGIPIGVEDIVAEGIACAHAGAAIIHVHAYDPGTGMQQDSPDLYSAIIEGIRKEADAIVYPSIPLSGDQRVGFVSSARSRFAAVAELGRRGLLEWAVVDPGSVNLERYADIERGSPGFIYFNSPPDIAEGLTLARQYRFHPSYACYEAGFVRLGAALARSDPRPPQPIFRFMFSDEFTFGFPPQTYALNALRRLLSDEAPHAPWMIAGLGVDILPLAAEAIEHGGHIRVGLEDAPFGTGRTNIDLVESAARTIVSLGQDLATAQDIRNELSRAPITREDGL